MYYHSTDVHLPVGEMLIPTSSGFVGSREVTALESLFELVRPEGEIARSAASYCCSSLDDLDGAGGREGLVYSVEPVGDVQWSDLAWYTEAQLALEEGDTKSARLYASSYWSGEPFPVVNQRLPEGRCRALRIVDRVESPERETVIAEGVPVLEALQSMVPLPKRVLADLLVTPQAELVTRGADAENATHAPGLPEGAVAIWGYGDRREFSILSLETLRGDQLQATVSAEAEERIKQHPSYHRYRELTLSGSVPPPIHACQSHDGRIRSANRRRLLVAQETETPLRAWLERLNPDTTVISYGQFLDAVGELQARIASRLEPKTPQVRTLAEPEGYEP